jgi:hypothetical protein
MLLDFLIQRIHILLQLFILYSFMETFLGKHKFTSQIFFSFWKFATFPCRTYYIILSFSLVLKRSYNIFKFGQSQAMNHFYILFKIFDIHFSKGFPYQGFLFFHNTRDKMMVQPNPITLNKICRDLDMEKTTNYK